jgi:hypothetical protein
MTERKLAERKAASYAQQHLRDVLADIARKYDVELYISRARLEESGKDTNLPFPVDIDFNQIRGDMLLDLVLGAHELVYMIRDGIIIVTTHDDLEMQSDVRVYNCLDLISLAGSGPVPNEMGMMGAAAPGGMVTAGMMPGAPGSMGAAGMSGGMPGMGMPGMAMGMGMPGNAMPGMPAGGPDGGFFGGPGGPPSANTHDALVSVITATIEPDTWVDAGGRGTIEAYFGGLLVVNNNPYVHRKIEKLLQMMREAARRPPGTVVRE